jgi:hypothetical protein
MIDASVTRHCSSRSHFLGITITPITIAKYNKRANGVCRKFRPAAKGFLSFWQTQILRRNCWYDCCFSMFLLAYMTLTQRGRYTMADKKYRIKAACPQCGCSFAQVLSKEEIQERYGDAPNVHLECGECMMQYDTDMQTACPEWDKECRLKE